MIVHNPLIAIVQEAVKTDQPKRVKALTHKPLDHVKFVPLAACRRGDHFTPQSRETCPPNHVKLVAVTPLKIT